MEVVRGDMMDPESLLRAMDGADAVITSAARYTRHSKGDTAAIDVTGNANLAEAAAPAGSSASGSGVSGYQSSSRLLTSIPGLLSIHISITSPRRLSRPASPSRVAPDAAGA